MYYVYVLQNQSNNSLYIGYSNNLKRRMQEHVNKEVASTSKAKYKLIYYEAYCDKRDATGREKFLKSGSGRKYINKQLLNYLKN